MQYRIRGPTDRTDTDRHGKRAPRLQRLHAPRRLALRVIGLPRAFFARMGDSGSEDELAEMELGGGGDLEEDFEEDLGMIEEDFDEEGGDSKRQKVDPSQGGAPQQVSARSESVV